MVPTAWGHDEGQGVWGRKLLRDINIVGLSHRFFFLNFLLTFHHQETLPDNSIFS